MVTIETFFGDFSTLRLLGLLGVVGSFFVIKLSVGRSVPQKFLRAIFVSALLLVILFPNVLNPVTKFLGFEELLRGRFVVFLSLLLGIVCFVLMVLDHNLQVLKLQLRRIQIENYVGLYHSTANFRSKNLVVMPAFNEAKNLVKLLPKLTKLQSKYKFDVLIIDDCSDDDSVDLIAEFETIEYISLRQRSGQGFALRVGYEFSKHYNYKAVATMDSDNQHDPNDLERFFEEIETSGSDLVIGSRVLGENNDGKIGRKMGIWLLSHFVTLVTKTRITDCSSGYKVMKVAALKKVDLVEDQFQSLDILFRFTSAKLLVHEIPISIAPRDFGSSLKGNFWSYGYGFTTVLIKNIFK